MENFGERLKNLRLQHNMTVSELAEKLEVSVRSINFYESNSRETSFHTLQRISSIFNCSIDYLLGKTDDPTPKISSENPVIIDLYELLSSKRRFSFGEYELSEDDKRNVRRMLDIMFFKDLEAAREKYRKRSEELFKESSNKYDNL